MMSRGSLFTNIILTISFGKLIIANTELAGLSMFKNLLGTLHDTDGRYNLFSGFVICVGTYKLQ